MKLFVAGCSFSDYCQVDKTYGDFLSNKLGYDFVSEAAGCGSNWRIWRKITNHILNKNLTSDDLLIVQYTDITRVEWFSNNEPVTLYTERGTPLAEEYDDGTITKFKMNSYTWQSTKKDSRFHEMYENYHLNLKFETEKFNTFNYMFQTMLKENNIKTIFIKTWRYQHENYVSVIDHFKPHVFEDIETDETHKYNLSSNDVAHLSQEGHQIFADQLYNHIINNKVVGV